MVRIPVRRGVEVSSLLAGIAGAFAQTLGGSLTAKASASLIPHSPTRVVCCSLGFTALKDASLMPCS